MRTTTALVALLLVGVACGGGQDGQDPADTQAAVLDVIDAGLEVTVGEFDTRPGEDGEALDHGTRLDTDATGFGEVQYLDGSLTRLDVNSTMVVVALDATVDRLDLDVELEGGRSWNRVRAGDDTTYEVTTQVGIAAVRGTAFIVDCRLAPVDGGCLFQVFEGQVEISTISGEVVLLDAGQQVTVAPDGTPGPVEQIPDAAFADPFVAANIDRDDGEGFAPLGPDDGQGPTGEGISLPSTDDPPSDANGTPIEPGTIVAVDNESGQYSVIHPSGEVAALDTALDGIGDPRWSPDGRLIAFHADSDNGTSDIFVIRPDGTGLTQVTTTADEYEQNPAWSADGRRMAVRLGTAITVVDLDSGTTSEIFRGDGFVGGMDWAWSGRQLIAFGVGNVIHRIDPSGADAGTFDFGGGGMAGWVRWLPDGAGLSVEFNDKDANQSRFVLDLDDNRVEQGSGQIRADWLSSSSYVFRQSGIVTLRDLETGQDSPITSGSHNSPDAWVPPAP